MMRNALLRCWQGIRRGWRRTVQARESQKMKLVPDEGWCWVMLVAACVLMFLVFGVHYTYGILYPSLLEEFKMGEGKTAWVGSLSSGLMFLTSICAIKLCDITSVSTTLMLGAVLSGAGLILTSVVEDFNALYFVYGVLFGTGTSLLYTPCLIMVGRWFVRYQAVTTGAAVASCALGAVVLSPLIQHVILINGLRKAIKACGIAYLTISMVCALCFKPFTNHNSNNKNNKKTEEMELTISRSQSKNNNNTKEIGVTTTLSQSYQEGAGIARESNHGKLVIVTATAEEEGLQNEDEEEHLCLHIGDETTKRDGEIDENKVRNDFTVNWKLLRNKRYVLFLVAMALTNFTYYMPIVHLVNYSTRIVGVSPTSASFLISIWSVANIVGRLVFGKLTSCVNTTRPRILIIYQTSMFLSGVVTALAYFADNHWKLVCYVITYGFLDGSFIGLMSLVTLDIVGMKDFAQGHGLMLTVIGLPVALGPPVIGMVNDSKTLPPQFMFLLAGGLFILGSIVMNFVRILHHNHNKDEEEEEEEEEEEAGKQKEKEGASN